MSRKYNPKMVYNAKGQKVATIKSRHDENIEAVSWLFCFGYLIIYLPILTISGISAALLHFSGGHDLFSIMLFCFMVYILHNLLVSNQYLQKIYFALSALFAGGVIGYLIHLWLRDVIWAVGIGVIATYGLYRFVQFLGQASFGAQRSPEKLDALWNKLTED